MFWRGETSGGDILREENVVDASYPTPIQFKSCSSTQRFANQASAGTLVPGFNNDTGENVNELSNVQDAILLAI